MTTTKSKFKELRSAIREGDTGMARGLIAADHELGRACDLRDGWTALMSAAFWGRVDCVEALIPLSNCEAVDGDGRTALMLAARIDCVDCMMALFPVSNCNAVNKDGWTALMFAARYGHVDCVETLLPFVNFRAVNKEGLAASHLARESGHNEVADLIDAYALAQEERAALSSLTEGRAASRAKARSL